MQVHERRRLLTNIETLVKRPAQADAAMMVEVLTDLGSLYSEFCGRKVIFLPVCAEVPGNQEQLDNFTKTVLGTEQEHNQGE